MIRAVLDSNILVSALIKKGGKPYQVLARAQSKFEWLTSQFILKEVAEVLARRHIQTRYSHRVTLTQTNNYFKRIRRTAKIVQVRAKVAAVREDLKDNPILACGVDGKAQFVVTGDPHLHTLKSFRGIEIVTPAQFLEVLDQSQQLRR